MKMFSLFGRRSLDTEWNYTPGGGIWRILFTSGRIVGECRNHESKQASFFCLDERTGSVAWQDVRVNEPWWVGIDALHQGVIILHLFANPSLPEHKGLIALDLDTGRELWRNEQLTFWFAYRDKLFAYKTEYERRTCYALRLRDGAIEQEFGDALAELFVLRQLAADEQEREGFLFPEVVNKDSLTPQESAVLKKELHSLATHGDIEMIRQDGYMLMNYYRESRYSTPEALILENHFSVYNLESGNRLFSDILSTNAKAATPDSFFMRNNLAFFVKNQNTLTALRLDKGQRTL